MSTTPGDSTWADAGLVPPDNSEVPGSERTTTPVEAEDQPRAARPVLRDEAAEHDALEQQQDPTSGEIRGGVPAPREDAAEHDVLEQSQEVGGYEEDAPVTAGLRDDAAEHDVLEQSQEVPADEEDEYPAP